MDVVSYNRTAWDRQVEQNNPWTVPVSSEAIAAARRGEWSVLLTETKPTPRSWFPADLHGCDLLCLASGGGQQGPILAAAGARVTLFDNSPRQLAQDRKVAEREGLEITLLQGDMADLSVFGDESFELIFHPVSNLFVPDVRPVWREAFRVLRRGGVLLAGFLNPLEYIFDRAMSDQGILQVRFRVPYSDLTSISEEERIADYGPDAPLEFGHTLDDQIGGQIDAGFHLIGFYEDYRSQDVATARYMPSYIATRAIKPLKVER